MINLPCLVGVAGKAGSGKDTAANFLCTRYGFNRYSLSTPIKRAIQNMFDLNPAIWRGEMKETVLDGLGRSPRELAQTLGTEWGRKCVSPDIWIKFLEMEWERLNRLYQGELRAPGLVIPDIRFDNEADWIVKNGGVVVRVDRPARLNARGQVNPHSSEEGIDEACIDMVIDNDTDDVIEFLQRFNESLNRFATQAEGLVTEWFD